MVKVIVRRASTGMAAASTLLVAAGSGTLGCAVEAEETDLEPVTEADLAFSGAGSAVLVLEGQSGPVAQFGFQVIASTTDEFVRAGETLNIAIPAYLLWESLYPSDPVPNAARLKQLLGTITVELYDKALLAGTMALPLTTFTGVDPYDIDVSTNAFKVPAKIDALKFQITIKDSVDPAAVAQIAASSVRSVPVFGGELPQKTLFFDNNGQKFRQRILEGDSLVAGASALIAYSDWRADALSNKGALNTQIGVAVTASRFGFVDVPIYGKIVHEVSYSVQFNDGLGWRPEAALPPVKSSRVLPAERTSFESTLKVPPKASRMSLYLHVKTNLVADYTGVNNIKEKWYSDNQQVPVSDKYDNPFGPFTNYDYILQN